MRSRARLLLLAAWVSALVVLTVFVQHDLKLGTDLRLFLPAPTTPEQRLLLEEIGEGPASRILAVSLQGATPEQLAETSRALAAVLREDQHFRFVANGETSLDAIPTELLAYRYLLAPTLDERTYDAAYLRTQLEQRARDLASPAGGFLEELLPNDPTLELLKILESWQPMQEPRREFDVWFDREGERALLLVETHAAAFDPEQQRLALNALHDAFDQVNEDPAAKLHASGAGAFSVLMEARTRTDAQRLGALATLGMLLLLAFAYRRPEALWISALPLASAALAGLAAVSALFDAVHGITLAFGFTLIGVAQDYPVHLLSHRRPDHANEHTARELWPTLATGVASTCIAYLTFWFSGVIGLKQLACFTVAGLATAALTTRFLLPRLMAEGASDASERSFVARAQRVFSRAPRSRWVIAALLALCAGLLASADQAFWENDLSKLTPVPEDMLEADQEVRSHLGSPDVRYLLVVEAADTQAALRRLESLEPRFAQLMAAGVISGYDHAARYTPSAATQSRRQGRLPHPDELRRALDAALRDAPFRPEAFDPFIEDVARARSLPPLTPAELRDTPLGASLEILLSERDAQTLATVTFSGVTDVRTLENAFDDAGADVRLLDLKDASESLVVAQRERMVWTLSVAALLLIGVVWIALRQLGRVVRVIGPMALTTVLIVAILHGAGVSLTLFHLIALILAAGLGLDYALFFERAAHDPGEQRRTLHAILVCSASTLLVFALLASSTLPVLQAIGVTVSIGVIANFVLAMVMTQPRRARLDVRD